MSFFFRENLLWNWACECDNEQKAHFEWAIRLNLKREYYRISVEQWTCAQQYISWRFDSHFFCSHRSKKRRKIKNILTGPRLAGKNDNANWNFFLLAFYHFIARLVDEQVFFASEDEKCENMISASLITFLLALQRSSEVVNIKRSDLIENIFAKSSRISESDVDMHWSFEADQRGLVTQFVISFCSAPWRRSARIVYLRKSPM